MEKAYVKNTASKKQVKEASRKERDRNINEISDLKVVLGIPEGRRVLWKYLSECGVYKTSFTGNSETFFNEGRRTIGLKIIADIYKSDVDAYALMMKENKEGDYNV